MGVLYAGADEGQHLLFIRRHQVLGVIAGDPLLRIPVKRTPSTEKASLENTGYRDILCFQTRDT